jgi:predicted DNA-binding transcriptional regulator AlpA
MVLVSDGWCEAEINQWINMPPFTSSVMPVQ